ncbi:surface protein [Plasmodium cynomolgi strain B]|uniref:Surface protein n=1 Tax=Plasmodium cynomolgi (strain B) TaxID=1120755 RepID=K6UEK1_PLACD|nr:surface protein [Plasmodium cynomolgi strain B]GAB68491.1 surface protein [Plasmodium cynomolgi strain B]
MKLPPLCRIPLALLLLCLTSRTRCYVHNDVIKFGEENSLKCSQGSLYILHCEVKCVNEKNRIIHKSCIDQVEAKCMGNRKCKYYFDYVFKRRTHSLRDKNEIEIEECVESEKNEIKTSTTCLLSNSFFLDETHVKYFFFIKNKNKEPITCKEGHLNIKSAILHSPFCKVNLKDITDVLKRQCDNNRECVINPYVLQKDALNEKDQCYINNSYVSLNVVCTKEEEEQNGESTQKQKPDNDLDETEEENYDTSLDKKKGETITDGNDDTEVFNKEDELKRTNDEVDHIMNSSENFSNKIKKAKSILLSQMNEQVVKKKDIFNKLGNELSKMLVNKYDASDLKDLLEDRYNEMKRSPDQDLYYLYLLDTLDINKMEDVDITSLQENLAKVLKEEMEKLNQVEKNINRLRKKYLSIYNKAKNNDMKEIFDENYKPTIKALNFSKTNVSDMENVEEKKEYKDLLEMDILDDYNRKKRIIDMRNGLVETLKKLYYEKNGIFHNLASCIKSYCYKNPLNLNVLSSVLKRNFENLKEKKITDPVAGIVRYLEKVGSQVDSLKDNASQVGEGGAVDGAVGESAGGAPRWEKDKRILQKLQALLHLGYQQVYDKELEIDERTEKYNALNEKAKEYNLDRLFSESDKVLKKVAVLTSANESADEVFGNQASFFDVYKEGEGVSEKGDAVTQKGDAVSEKGDAVSEKGDATSDQIEAQTDEEKMKEKEKPKNVKGSNSDEEENNDGSGMNDLDEGYESAKEEEKNALDEKDSGGDVESVEEKGEAEKENEEGESEDAEGVDAGSNKESGGDEDGESGEGDDGLLEAGSTESTASDDAADGDSTESTAADEAAGEVAEPAEADQNDAPVKGEDIEDSEHSEHSDGAEDADTEIRGEAEEAEQPTGEAVVKGDSEGEASGLETEKKGDDGGSFFQGLSRALLAVLAILSLELLL